MIWVRTENKKEEQHGRRDEFGIETDSEWGGYIFGGVLLLPPFMHGKKIESPTRGRRRRRRRNKASETKRRGSLLSIGFGFHFSSSQ